MNWRRSLILIIALVIAAVGWQVAERKPRSEQLPVWTSYLNWKHQEVMKAMNEPSLIHSSDERDVEEYRFLWLRTFHHPIAVRIRKDASGMILRTIRLSGAGGYAPGLVEEEATFKITTAQWNEFLKLERSASFWKMSPDDPYEPGFDGSWWVLEGAAPGQYQRVARWSPSSDHSLRQLDGFIACCRYLLALSKEPIAGGEDY